ncbi:ECF transporter S component [Orenia metallireducens]|jgi:hypothetical protein|uniref:ECF transporter S component n=1 Tax=Orenia metallireducens TaxID=1413210 RepID=A0A1C0A859_9FIRM|nr:ECF transporter S component [Orenia metallireducens]OCL26401.1 ECF transporter S component [Orenia metallireducens]
MKYTKWLTRTAILLALTLVVQALGFPAYITGPLVNMMLLLATILVGLESGLLIGALTPWIALVRGILPPPLAVMIPFIIISNLLWVLIYHFLAKKNKYLGIGLAALSKYGILASAVNFLVNVPPKIATLMQVPQLLTALAGGLLALSIVKAINLSDVLEEK